MGEMTSRDRIDAADLAADEQAERELEELHAENGDTPHGPPSSLLDSLRARRAELAGEHTYDMEVPGYDGCLVLRLAPLRGQEIAQLARRAEASKAPDREFHANASIIIRSCRAVLARENREEELRTLHPDEVTTLTLNDELAELMGIHAPSAIELLKALWDKVPSPEISIGMMAGEFVEWSSQANQEDEEVFQGESPAAPK